MLEEDYDDDDYDWQNNGNTFRGEEKRKSDAVVNHIMKQLPPSLNLFFEQFDRALNLGGFLNQKPLSIKNNFVLVKT